MAYQCNLERNTHPSNLLTLKIRKQKEVRICLRNILTHIFVLYLTVVMMHYTLLIIFIQTSLLGFVKQVCIT